MSAASVGRNLLADVEEVGLDDLLLELRCFSNPRRADVVGVPAIDRLLDIFRNREPHETPGRLPQSSAYPHDAGQDSFYHNDSSSPTRPARHHQSVVTPPVIELSSPKSASGKTNLLYYLVVLSILPKQYGGKSSTVVWLDADGRFSASRLGRVMQQVISTRDDSAIEAPQDVIRASLKHVHVFRPQSSMQLISILINLQDYLLDETLHSSISRPLDVIVLDSATTFYWQDRWEADIARLERGRDLGQSETSSRASEVIGLLRHLQTKFECTVVFTTSSGMQVNLRAQERRAEPAASSPWTSFATMTLQMSRAPVPQFSATMSLQDCLRDQEKRFQAVSKSKFVVSLDWTESDTWTRGVRQALSQLDGRGAFLVGIDEEGVVVEDGHG